MGSDRGVSVPFPCAPGSVGARGGWPEQGARLGEGEGRGSPPARPWPRPAGAGGVSYLGRGGRRDCGPRAQGRDPQGSTFSRRDRRRLPIPRRRLRRDGARPRGAAAWVVPSGTVRVYWRRRLLLLLLLLRLPLATPRRCSCASPRSSSCRRRRRLVPTAPIAAAATTAAPADPTRRYSPPSQPATA